MYMRMYVCKYMYVCVRMNYDFYSPLHTGTGYILTHTNTHIHSHTRLHIHTHTHTHTHTHGMPVAPFKKHLPTLSGKKSTACATNRHREHRAIINSAPMVCSP